MKKVFLGWFIAFLLCFINMGLSIVNLFLYADNISLLILTAALLVISISMYKSIARKLTVELTEFALIKDTFHNDLMKLEITSQNGKDVLCLIEDNEIQFSVSLNSVITVITDYGVLSGILIKLHPNGLVIAREKEKNNIPFSDIIALKFPV